MISEVSVAQTTFKEPPHKFEAGTPNIAGVIGAGAAAQYLTNLGMHDVRAHEQALVSYALQKLKTRSYVHILGSLDAKNRAGVIAFTMDGVHPHDIAQLLDRENICIRAGNHCAMPLHTSLSCAASARASFYVYTTTEDIDALVDQLEKIYLMFR
jgi:cysteine desulfurase/selenocysteine lyase